MGDQFEGRETNSLIRLILIKFSNSCSYGHEVYNLFLIKIGFCRIVKKEVKQDDILQWTICRGRVLVAITATTVIWIINLYYC